MQTAASRKTLMAALAVLFGLTLAACEEEGPLEKAGKDADKAMEKAGESLSTAGEKIEEAAED